MSLALSMLSLRYLLDVQLEIPKRLRDREFKQDASLEVCILGHCHIDRT